MTVFDYYDSNVRYEQYYTKCNGCDLSSDFYDYIFVSSLCNHIVLRYIYDSQKSEFVE